MTIAGYFLRAKSPEDLPGLMEGFEGLLANTGGTPVQPLSSVTAFIDIASYKEAVLRDSAATASLLGEHTSEARAIDENELYERWKSREREDLPERTEDRILVPGPQGSGNFDWNLVETRAVHAWLMFEERFGGAVWGDLRAGHIDTGFTEHTALGFTAAGASWVSTTLDRNFMAGRAPGAGEGIFPFVDERAEIAIDPLIGTNGGHGTKTMSLLCGYEPAHDFRGTAPMLPTVPVRLNDVVWIDNVLERDLPDAIRYLVDTAQVRLITLSMGSPHPFPIAMPFTLPIPRSLLLAIDYAYEQGVMFFCAAGNNIPNPAVVYPARLNRTIAVAGTTPGFKPWCGSSRGPQVDICAPAFPVYRAERHRDGTNDFGVGDGTSFATPQVCAAAALWLAWNGSAIYDTYAEPWQVVEAFRRVLVSSAGALAADPAWLRNDWGAGILNVEGVIRETLPPAGTLRKAAKAA